MDFSEIWEYLVPQGLGLRKYELVLIFAEVSVAKNNQSLSKTDV